VISPLSDLVAPMQSVLDPTRVDTWTGQRTGATIPCSVMITPTKFRLEAFPFGINIEEWELTFPVDADVRAGDYGTVAGKGLFWVDRKASPMTLDVQTTVTASRQRDPNGLIQMPTNITVTLTSSADPTISMQVTGYLWPALVNVRTVYASDFLQPWTFAWDGALTYSNGSPVSQDDGISFTINGVTETSIIEDIRMVLTPLPFWFAAVQTAMNNLILTFYQSSPPNQTSAAIPGRGKQMDIPRPLTGLNQGALQNTYEFWVNSALLVFPDGTPITARDTIELAGFAPTPKATMMRSMVPDLTRGLDTQIVVDLDW
jgi:hypothetical protein